MVDDADTPPQPTGASDETPAESGSTPPADRKVVSLAEAAATKAASNPSAGAAAPDKGTGGEKPAGKATKAQKKIDWGKYNYLLANFTLIYGTDTVWDADTRKMLKISNMAHAHGSDMVRMWKAAADRKTVQEEDVVFDPTGQCAPHCINLYNGFATVPMACADAEVKPMLDLLHHLCSESESEHATVDDVIRWVLCWIALPLQKPGAKLATALVFHGPQGTGKNLFFDVVRKMFGKYGVMVGQNELEEKFNDWLSGKLMVIGNEVVTRQELFHNKNKLKWIISEEQIPIRAMQQSVRWEKNHANLVFLSNEQMPLVLEDNDRRHLVVYTPLADEAGLYARVLDFLGNDGAAKFMHFLMNYPLEDFHEHTKPLMTTAKLDLQELSQRPPERFMVEWFGGFLPLPRQVCSGDQLYRVFEAWARRSGLKWVDDKAKFTSTVGRWAKERIERDAKGERLPPCIEYKVVQLKDDLKENGRTAVKCWLPRGTGPMNGVSWGEFAGDAVAAFELPLGRYLRSGREGAYDEKPAGEEKQS
ncbi:MAG: primase-helicase family protein [Pseudomonadota bacterium]